MVKLIVGKEKKEFMVHKFLLLDHIRCFQSTIENGCNEDEALKQDLSHDNPGFLGMTVEWLYEHAGRPFTSKPWDGLRHSVETYCQFWNRSAYGFDVGPEMNDHIMRQLHAWR